MIAATKPRPAHDPLPPFTIGYVMDRIDEASPRGTMQPYVRGNARDFLLRNSGYSKDHRGRDDWNIFLRAPFVECRNRRTLDLRWYYDGHELVLQFDELSKTGAILKRRRVSEEEAVAAVIAWNQHVIRGEARRIREQNDARLACAVADLLPKKRSSTSVSPIAQEG